MQVEGAKAWGKGHSYAAVDYGPAFVREVLQGCLGHVQWWIQWGCARCPANITYRFDPPPSSPDRSIGKPVTQTLADKRCDRLRFGVCAVHVPAPCTVRPQV